MTDLNSSAELFEPERHGGGDGSGSAERGSPAQDSSHLRAVSGVLSVMLVP